MWEHIPHLIDQQHETPRKGYKINNAEQSQLYLQVVNNKSLTVKTEDEHKDLLT